MAAGSRRAAPPLDPRLLRRAAGARWALALGAAIAALQTLVTIAIAGLLAWLIAEAVAGAAGEPGFGSAVLALAGAIAARALLAWLAELAAVRGAARVKSELRAGLLRAIADLGPAWARRTGSARLATLAGQGLDALDAYFARFLPQLLLTAIATPVLVGVLFLIDWPTGLTVLITLPLIPLFMVLVGLVTQAVQQRQWQQLTALAGAFLDAIAGLATLKIFRREHRQAQRLRAVADEHRRRTMAVLRVSFLSGFVLELAASLSVALVALSIGVRLVYDELGLFIGLFALLLAPEAYLPLRGVGAQFHASAEGTAAAREALDLLDQAAPLGVLRPAPPGGREDPLPEMRAAAATAMQAGGGGPVELRVRGLVAGHAGGPEVLRGLDARFAPGALTAVAGPSGAGKSTLVAALLGFAEVRGGTIELAGAELPPAARRELIAWSGQRAELFAGTVAENLALGAGAGAGAGAQPLPERVAEALRLAGLHGFDPALALDALAAGASGGQAQRIALARAVYRALEHGCPVLIADEPTSALDDAAEAAVLAGLAELAAAGRTVIVLSHRPAVLAAADRVVVLDRGRGRAAA